MSKYEMVNVSVIGSTLTSLQLNNCHNKLDVLSEVLHIIML